MTGVSKWYAKRGMWNQPFQYRFCTRLVTNAEIVKRFLDVQINVQGEVGKEGVVTIGGDKV